MTYFRTRAGNIQESKDVLKTKQKCLIDKGLSKGHKSQLKKPLIAKVGTILATK